MLKIFIGLLVAGLGLHQMGASSIPVVSEYDKLLKLCQDGDSSTYVGVRYQGDYYTTYSYGQCYPYELNNGSIAEMAVFCKTVVCNSNPNRDCTGGSVLPAPIPVVPGLTLVNVADFVRLIGEGATCYGV